LTYYYYQSLSSSPQDVGHSTDARELMKKYKVGELVESERKAIPVKPQPDWSNSDKKDEK
jgi:hypothetical protein